MKLYSCLANDTRCGIEIKNRWIKCLSLLLLIVVFIGCKNNNWKSTTGGDTDPILQTDPKLKAITDQIKQLPKDATLYFQRGQLLQKMQLDSLALKDYKTATTIDSTKGEYYSAIGDLLFEHKDLTGSVVWIQKAIARNPTDRKAHLKIAKLFLYIKDYAKAFAEINIVLRQDVYNPEAYFLKGMVYKDLRDTAKSMSAFQTAVQVSPDYRDAILELGILYSAKKDPIALKYFDRAYSIDSTDVSPIYAKGVYYQDMKDDANAKSEYRKCILRNGRYVDAFFNIGYIFMQEDSIGKAWRQYDIVTHIDPRNPAGYFNRGLCSEMMDSVKKAIEDYKTAAALDGTYKSPKDALKRLGVN